MTDRPPHPNPRHEAVIALTCAMVPVIHDAPVDDVARDAIKVAVQAIFDDPDDHAGRALLAALPSMLRLNRCPDDSPDRQRLAHEIYFGVLRQPTPLTEGLPMPPMPAFPARWDDRLSMPETGEI